MPDSVYVAKRSSRVWYYQAKKNLAEEQIHSQGTHWPHCITNSHTANSRLTHGMWHTEAERPSDHFPVQDFRQVRMCEKFYVTDNG